MAAFSWRVSVSGGRRGRSCAPSRSWASRATWLLGNHNSLSMTFRALFVKSARKVMDNELWLPKSQVARLAQLLEGAQERPRRPPETLTRQEKAAITYLMQGGRNREIARHLSITEQTVKNHLRTIYDKVGVSDRLELVLYAIHQRLELPAVQPAEALP